MATTKSLDDLVLDLWEPSTALADALKAPDCSELEKAKRLLGAMFDGIEMDVDSIRWTAESAWVSERTLRRAKAAMAIKATRKGFGPRGYWVWMLPQAANSDTLMA